MEWAGWLGWLRDIVHRRSARRSRKIKAQLTTAVRIASDAQADRDRWQANFRAGVIQSADLQVEANALHNALRTEADLLGFQLERTNMQIELLRMQVEHSGAMIATQRDWIESFRAHPNEGRIP